MVFLGKHMALHNKEGPPLPMEWGISRERDLVLNLQQHRMGRLLLLLVAH